MKAAVWHNQRDIRVESADEPSVAGPGEVLVEPQMCGICGSDLHEYTDGPQYIPLEPHPMTGDAAPVVMGHEFSALVAEVGPGVTAVKRGDRVAVYPLQYCGQCAACRRGYHAQCKFFAVTGLHTKSGGLGRVALVKDYQCMLMPENMTWQQGALTEPSCVSTHAVDRGGVQPGDTVLITGGGPIGTLAAMAARIAGASRIFLSEPVPFRRERAANAAEPDRVIDPTTEDVAAVLQEATDGWGADVTIEASANERALRAAIDATRKGGTIVQLAVFTGPVTILPASDLTNVEKSLIGSLAFMRGDWPRVMQRIASGQMKSERVVTAEVPLDDVLELAFDDLIRPGTRNTKVLVQVS